MNFGSPAPATKGCTLNLNEHGAFLGHGTPLLARDGHGDFAPLPQRDLEIVVAAGFGIAVDLGSRMGGLATVAKALNAGDYALASIALAHLQFPALPDKGAGARMQKTSAMLERGGSPAEVLQRFLPPRELAKDNPYHLGPGTGGGQFTRRSWTERVPGTRNPALSQR